MRLDHVVDLDVSAEVMGADKACLAEFTLKGPVGEMRLDVRLNVVLSAKPLPALSIPTHELALFVRS